MSKALLLASNFLCKVTPTRSIPHYWDLGVRVWNIRIEKDDIGNFYVVWPKNFIKDPTPTILLYIEMRETYYKNNDKKLLVFFIIDLSLS